MIKKFFRLFLSFSIVFSSWNSYPQQVASTDRSTITFDPRDQAQAAIVAEHLQKQGFVFLANEGMGSCLKYACNFSKSFTDPNLGQVYTRHYVSYAEVLPNGQVSLTLQSGPNQIYYEQGIVLNGEIIPEDFAKMPGPGVGYQQGPGDALTAGPTPSPGTATSQQPQQGNSKQDNGVSAGMIALNVALMVFSDQLSVGTHVDNDVEIQQRLQRVSDDLAQQAATSKALLNAAEALVGSGIQAPPELMANLFANKNIDRVLAQPPRVLSRLSEVKSYSHTPQTIRKAEIDLEKAFQSKDIKALHEYNEYIADYKSRKSFPQSLPIKDGVMQLNGPLDGVQFKSSPGTVYGRVVRRAANKAQTAYAYQSQLGKNLLEDQNFTNGVAALKIADERFASNIRSWKEIQQAEGLAYYAEKSFEIAGGFVDGVQSSIDGYVELAQSIPEMGSDIWKALKEAANDPVAAVNTSRAFLMKTPEMMGEVVKAGEKYWEQLKKAPSYEAGKLTGMIATEAVAAWATTGALNAAKATAIGARAVRASALVTGRVTSYMSRVAKAGALIGETAKGSMARFGNMIKQNPKVLELVEKHGATFQNTFKRLGITGIDNKLEFVDWTSEIGLSSVDNIKDLSEKLGGKIVARHNLLDPGPLKDELFNGSKVMETFRSASYFEVVTEKPIRLYRVFSEGKDGLSSPFWSRVKPEGPYQATLDSALDPAWKNSAKEWVAIDLPPGHKIYEGFTSDIVLESGGGSILGGGSQVYLRNIRIDPSWIPEVGGRGVFK